MFKEGKPFTFKIEVTSYMLNEAGKVVERKMQTIAISINSCDDKCARCDNIAFENYLMNSGLGFTLTERESFWFASIGCGECPLG